MSWQSMQAPAGIVPGPHLVSVAMQPRTAVRRHALVVLIRPLLMQQAPRWLCDGAYVQAQLGTGADHGQLQIKPHGNLPLVCANRGGTLVLRLAPPEGCSAVRHSQTPVEHDYTDDWLALTLPAWAMPTRLPGVAGIRPTDPRGIIRGFALAQEAAR